MTATLYIDLTDAEGHATGRTVPVVVEFCTRAYEYGEDADGNHGEILYEDEVLDVWIDHEDLKTLTTPQAEQVLAEARVQCAERRMV